MNSRPTRSTSMVENQAALWAARLDGDVLDADQRAALDAWLAEDPEHRAVLSQYCQFSADLEEKVQALRAAGAVPAATPTSARRGRRRFTRVTAIVLAAAAAIAVAARFAWPAPQAVQNVATAVAQRQAHTLADGTRVELNAHTSLRFENSGTERRVRLAGGEALFQVAKDPARPFIVETPGGSVRVTGTTFNVRNDAGPVTLEVTVVEGSVQVRPSYPPSAEAAGPISLVAGEQLSAGGAGVTKRALPESALEDALAWREGYIVCEDMPLHEFAARFARYHGRRITVDPAVAWIGVGGRYGLDDFGAFTDALETALPVTVHYDPSGAVSIVPRTGSH